MPHNEGEQITIHNTDKETDAKATIVEYKGDFLRVLIDGTIAMNLTRKEPGSDLFVGNMHGLEFTTCMK